MRVFIILGIMCAFPPVLARAQVANTGVIQGVVTTQAGTVRLPGAQLKIQNSSLVPVGVVISESDGRFNVSGLPEGQYSVSASLEGFLTTTRTVRVTIGQPAEVPLDLPLAGFSASVKVEAPTSAAILREGTIAPTDAVGGTELEQFAPTGGLESAMRLLASVVQVPNGLSIKGGLPSQASVQLGQTYMVDPATGLMQLVLPDVAIDSVSVLPNPYAVEYGRFSSGLTVIQTRRGGDQWKARLDAMDPSFRYRRGSSPLNIIGLGWYAPQLEFGGPLIKDRLFLEQTAQYRYQASETASLPQDELRISQSFSSFTRLDGQFSSRHSFVATAALFPSVMDSATLGTFTPQPATVNIHSHTNEIAFSERAVWTKSLLTETTVQAHVSEADAVPQGPLPMVLRPEQNGGNFFNQQHRNTDTFQLVEALSTSTTGPGGQHLFKVGFDVLHNQYDGWSVSRPVQIKRDDGTLARLLSFSTAPAMQSIGSTDVALFAQDRFQPNARWYTEFGLRLDRDGVVDRLNLTPRVGSAVLLNQSGSAILRGGFGLFYERTPSTAGVFNAFGGYVDTRYASDGVTTLAPPVAFTYAAAPGLETPRSQTWNVAYDHQLNKYWAIHVGGLNRQGNHELIVNPVQTGTTTGTVLLTSSGRSSYREAEFGVHFTYASKADVNVSYARSADRSDLNALTNYFDTILNPVVGANAYGPASADVPNRLFARGRYMPTPKWLFLGIFDWRSGLPYSAVNEPLDFVGPRNGLRFPSYRRLETGIEHRFKILKLEPWIGVRIWNTFNAFLPWDVQANVGSSAFGTFYNSEYRQFRIQIRFER
jgi:carboxypeptidase family protein